MGELYCEEFGVRPFHVIGATLASDAGQDRGWADAPTLRPYFGGSLHLTYRENFSNFLSGLSRAAEHNGRPVEFTCRGGVAGRSTSRVHIRNLGWAAREEYLRDFQSADFGYLPLPFGEANRLFAQGAMPVKLVAYLEQGLPILYHGPAGSAVDRLVRQTGCGISVCENNAEVIAEAVLKIKDRRSSYANAAREAGRLRFDRSRSQALFQSIVLATTVSIASLSGPETDPGRAE
jgi:hypothetical protein